MTPEEIEKHINDAVVRALEAHLPAAVQTAVDTAVNGRIKKLQTDIQPIVDAFTSWSILKRTAAAFFLPLVTLAAFMASIAVTVHYLFPRK